MSQLLLCAIAFSISFFSAPVFRKLAIHFGVIAKRNHRTIHSMSTPKLGGCSIVAGSGLAWVMLSLPGHPPISYWAIIAGSISVHILGMFDDVRSLGCNQKLVGQSAAALLAALSGVRIESLYLPVFGNIDLGWIGFIITVLWIVGITNAINLLDGLDGLAAGFGIIAGSAIAVAAYAMGNDLVFITSLVLVSAIIGFLRYNINPAAVFLGDNGSLFIGFALACLSIIAFTDGAAATHLFDLTMVFLLPISDTLIAIVRRIRNGTHPFRADKQHIHHKCLERGLSQTSATSLLWVVAATSAAAALLPFRYSDGLSITIACAVLGVFLLLLHRLGCFDLVVTTQLGTIGIDSVAPPVERAKHYEAVIE